MSNGLMDVDPLSHYEYPSYDINPMPYQTSLPYSCIKLEERTPYNYNNASQNTYNTVNEPINNQSIVNNNQSSDINNLTAHNDGKKNVKTRKNKSNYCSEKIADANFAFYGCSVCNISYTALLDLDQHVVIHKDRMTSYRLRLKNQIKKKQMKKEKKKMKKLLKIKKETDLDVEIKPEDGYIGNEKACEYLSKEPDRNSDNLNNKEIINNSHCSLTQNSTLTNGLMKTDTTSDIQNNGNLLLKSSKDKENSNDANSSNKDNNSNKDDSSNNDSSSNNNGDREAMELNNLEKIYKCFACKKQFTLSYYLKLHVRSHTDEKPYTCSVCGQSFITASKLGRHNKRIHLAERYQCRICFKVFSRFELLTNHFDKKHPDDKLEGEPYDYNAILPYLKELEEQLANQNLKDDKLKAEDLWWIDGNAPSANGNVASTEGPTPSEQTEDKNLDQPNLKIAAEELKLDLNDDIKVKKEISDNEEHPGGDGITGEPGDPENDDDDVKDEPFKDDSNSDEDYFPSKTWLSSPKMDASPPPPHRRRPATLVCEVCNKRVSSASYLRVHMRTHTGERPFKCWRCGRGFITSSKMHRHVLTHDDTDGADEVKTEDGVVKSEAEDRPDNGKPTRKTKKSSKKKMKSKFSKKIKQEGEKREKKYQKRPHACEFCHQKFLHLEMLQVHKKSHEGETLVLKCHYCLTEIESEEALKEHEATHTGPKPYQCTICGKCYKKRETMVYHKKHHKPDREFVCDICSKRFNASCKLQKHMQTHRADKFVLRYECPVCAHMFNTKYHVQMHLATHLKEGLIVEQNRNEILAMVLQNARKIPKHPNSNSSLTDIMPTDERSRICNICGEIFQHFYYLEEHLKSHGSRIAIEDTAKAEVKKYICEICNKAFKLHYYLKLHSFTHSKEKPFICQQCGKGFITKGKLKRHLETHTGLKKYQCHICCKFFTRPSYLRIHIRTIHGTQDYNFIRYGSQ